MITLGDYLDAKRVSELQEFFSFWGAGNAPTRKADLRAGLLKLLQDEETVAKKIRVLSQAPMQLLLILIRSDDYRADMQSVFYNDSGIQLEYYEVEAAARALARRGFLEITRDKNWINYGKEVYVVPREIGETVSLLLAEERRGPREVFSLAGHLKGLSPQKIRGLLKRLDFNGGANGNGNPTVEAIEAFLVKEKGVRQLLQFVTNEKLRSLFAMLIETHGGVIARSRYEKEMKRPLKWARKRWQKFVEGYGLGTMSNITLEDYGIRLEGESVVVFKELVEGYFRDLKPEECEFDRVVSARIDLLTDLAWFLRYVGRNPVRVTQAKTLYKSAHNRIFAGMVFKEDSLVDKLEVLNLIWDLSRGLELVKVTDDRVLALTGLGEAWESLELVDQVNALYERMLEERAPEGRDFHLRKLRRLLSERLRAVGTNRWRPVLELPFVTRNDYLASLEDEGIRERYKNRFQYTYDPPKTTLPGLAGELSDWILRRLFVLGLVEVALEENEPSAVRLTDLGMKVLGVSVADYDVNGSAPIVVNPDFEVLVFPEGDVLEIVHTLDRFAVRTKSEEVSHYRILKEGVERAVVKGMTVPDILSFLSDNCRTPIPQNVEYSIRDWGEKIRFATQQDVVILTVDSEEVLDGVLALEAIRGKIVERVSPTVVALSEKIEDWRTLEDLRRLGRVHQGLRGERMPGSTSMDSRTGLIELLLSRAAREDVYVIVRFQEMRGRSVAVEGDKVEAVESAFYGGVGIQAFTPSGHNGFAAVDDPDEERALAALDRAVAAARASRQAGLAEMRGLFSAGKTTGRAVPEVAYPFDHLTVGEMKQKTLDLALRIGEGIEGLALRTGVGISRADWRIARTDGTDVTFSIPRAQAAVLVTARRDGRAVRTNASVSGTSYEVVLDEALIDRISSRAVRVADLSRALLDAPSYPAGTYPLLIDFALAKGLAHEAFGHAAESDGMESSILGKDGRFRTGERFGGENITIVDESIEADNAFQPYSGNGEPRRRAVILERGVLKEALADVHTAAKVGTPITGAGRLSGFSVAPLPRMSNIRLEVEDPVAVPEDRDFYDWTPEQVRDLLEESGDLPEGRKVLFLSGYKGGQVNPALGDFVFNSTAMYELTRDGVTLYKPGIFSGRIEAALHSIERAYGPLRLDAAGTCGKGGQGVPSSGGSHHFLLLTENEDIRIGGRS